MIAKAKSTFSSHLVLRIPKLRIIVPSRTCVSQKSLGVILGSSLFLAAHTQIIIALFILSPKYLLNLFAFLPIYCHSNYPKIFSLFLDLSVFLNLPLCLLVYILEFLIIFWLKSSNDFHCCHETKVLNLVYRRTWFASCSASQPHLSPLSFLETSALWAQIAFFQSCHTLFPSESLHTCCFLNIGHSHRHPLHCPAMSDLFIWELTSHLICSWRPFLGHVLLYAWKFLSLVTMLFTWYYCPTPNM